MIDVAVIIVSWNVRNYLADCLRSVAADLRVSRLNGEVWVVDNASTDGTVALLADLFPQVHVIVNQENLGFGAANNQGMRAASARQPRYYFFLNPDTLVRPGAIGNLELARARVGLGDLRGALGRGDPFRWREHAADTGRVNAQSMGEPRPALSQASRSAEAQDSQLAGEVADDQARPPDQ